MKENYINILTTFLADLLEKNEIKIQDIAGLLKVFQPVAAMVDSREKLIKFLNFYLEVYPKLEILINRLKDENYNFNKQ